ncbi:beta-propeller domain-containing protein [Acholeplasma vituli]|uniref:Beta-propeller domain-containing protein n=1 Tax=Paracholeplasma vituli TaxID=69473 RepID=A0ABT2PU36_9MOLU|nr:beta-propeller domain-containing protein [Paracholeplasma vituli]MCU0104460.1 beta-propeller domain-containing protein [Paracholeplasma vituli]
MKKITLLTLLFLVAFVMIGCQSVEKNMGLNAVGSLEDLKSLAKSGNNNVFYGPVEDAVSGAPESGAQTKTSKTNVQVEGVDEGDTVKVDENRIYQIFGNRLVVTSISGEMTTLLDETLSDEKGRYTYYNEIYITDSYLVVIGFTYQYYSFDIEGREVAYDMGFYPWYYNGATSVWVYELETLTVQNHYIVPGYQLSTRLIEDKLYLITYNYINLNNEDLDPRPVYEIDGEKVIPSYDEIYYHSDLTAQVFNNITTIDLKETPELTYDIFLGSYSWGTIYVSQQSIYFSNVEYTYDEKEGYQEEGKLIVFNFSDEGVVFGGMGSFEGYVINQFAIDEYDGYVRMVTTQGWGDTVKNRLYVFKKEIVEDKPVLTRVGFLDEGIGKPRERVFSVRFFEDEATIVTFEQIDPFYLIDLSNPTKPTIQAALEIPGFSLYQHRINPTTVLGIGYETVDARTVGIKLSLYNVSNPETLTEMGTPLVLMNSENGWQYGEALYNHKAILFDLERDYFGFSVFRIYFDEYRYYNLNEYMIFSIDLTSDTPVSIEKTITHQAFYQADPNDYYWYTPYSIERAVYVGDYLYVISSGAITKHDINNDFVQVADIQF